MQEEGIIKFVCNWKKTPPLQNPEIVALNYWRNQLYAQQLVGAYPNGVGYGNVSCRIDKRQFIISGSTTGLIKQTDHQHYALVEDYDIASNFVLCSGPIQASSESMSHAAIYQTREEVKVVFHLHHKGLWDYLLKQFPSTDLHAPYGSPQMAKEIGRLVGENDTYKRNIFSMGGHEEGIMAFGSDYNNVWRVIQNNLQKSII